MGQKVSPHGIRVGINKDWSSTWIANKKDFSKFLIEDQNIRKQLNKKYANCNISKIDIERTANRVVVDIYTSRPGVLIGNKGAGVEEIKKLVLSLTENKNVNINIKEVKKPDLDAMIVAQGIASQLEKRISFRRAMKQGMQKVMKAGAKGCKIQIGGRLDGAEIARSEHYQEGMLPLQTLRSDIDYAYCITKTTYGVLGVKVWICKGEILKKNPAATHEQEGGNANVNA